MNEINAAYEQIKNPAQNNARYGCGQQTNQQNPGYQSQRQSSYGFGLGTGAGSGSYEDFDPFGAWGGYYSQRTVRRPNIFALIFLFFMIMNMFSCATSSIGYNQQYYYGNGYDQSQQNYPPGYSQNGTTTDGTSSSESSSTSTFPFTFSQDSYTKAE